MAISKGSTLNSFNMIIKKTWPLFLMLFISVCVNAQNKIRRSAYKKHPYWIQMMNDTSVNYFETVKAFREYYKDRALPHEANEVEGEDNFEKLVGLEDEEEHGRKSEREKEREREMRKADPKEQDLSADVRAFKGWFYSIQPWVRSYGSIVGPKEQQAIIDAQRNELKAIEKQNGKH